MKARGTRSTAAELTLAGQLAGNDRSGDRTHDLKIKSLLLYQLSYPVQQQLMSVQVKRSANPWRLRLTRMTDYRGVEAGLNAASRGTNA